MFPKFVLLSAALLAAVPARADTVVASWYGPGFHGRVSASGCRFDQHGLSAASRSLPLGTILRLTRDGRTVTVVVLDRGPYIRGRSLDLSREAAERLGMRKRGVAAIEVEVIGLEPVTCLNRFRQHHRRT